MTTQSLSLRLADRLSSSPYTSVGCYPLFAVTRDGGVLCRHCCRTERESIGTTTGTDGWCVVALDVNWEDADLFCDHCGDRIESAYAEPDESAPAALPAALRTAARRLRYLRRHPSPHSYQSQGEAVRLGMSYAYEHALRLLIDEFGAQPEFHALFYGPQGEDPDGMREAGQ